MAGREEGEGEEMIDKKLPRTLDKDHRFVYSNLIEAHRTPWDIGLKFCRVEELSNEPTVTELVTICMTPALAKALISTLSSTLRSYEADNGPVNLPLSIQEKIKEQKEKAAVNA